MKYVRPILSRKDIRDPKSKYSKTADGMGYLYRAAFYLAKGDQKTATAFLSTASKKLSLSRTNSIYKLSQNPRKYFFDSKKQLYWAEKILDEYTKTLNLLARWDDFRTANWIEIVEYPDLILQQTQQLLAIPT